MTSDVLGRKITHRPVSAEEFRELKAPWAHWLYELELAAENGLEESWFNLSTEEQEKLGIEVFKGTTTAREWVQKHMSYFD